MGSLSDGDDSARPRHEVTIARPFAVAKFPLTFDQWDACARNGPCDPDVSDSGWGRGRRPVINVSWDDAQTYVKWLSKISRNQYRLLSESEYEYAARAGSDRIYPWGDDIQLNGQPMANCELCGSQWDGKQTAPVCGWGRETRRSLLVARSPPTRLASTIWRGTYGSGRTIVGIRLTKAHRSTVHRG
jgi:formylglycine-generating enzyme required for sulfatase activity